MGGEIRARKKEVEETGLKKLGFGARFLEVLYKEDGTQISRPRNMLHTILPVTSFLLSE